MLYLHKILPAFILPIMLVIILIYIGLKNNNKILIYTTIGVLYLISTPLFSKFLFKMVEGSEYKISIKNIYPIQKFQNYRLLCKLKISLQNVRLLS